MTPPPPPAGLQRRLVKGAVKLPAGPSPPGLSTRGGQSTGDPCDLQPGCWGRPGQGQSWGQGWSWVRVRVVVGVGVGVSGSGSMPDTSELFLCYSSE